MNNMKLKTILTTCAIMAASVASGQETPKGWFAAGSRPKDYKMVLDRSAAHNGKACAQLACVATKPTGFGTLMQTFKADAFRGKRVRMSGYVRSREVANWAGLWLRIDGQGGEALGFDNMQQRPIKATSDWKKYEIVLDVPDSAQAIAFGILLTGAGQVWIDDLDFEVVGTNIPTTASKPVDTTPSAPANLDFEE
jgi:hypothetical protein